MTEDEDAWEMKEAILLYNDKGNFMGLISFLARVEMGWGFHAKGAVRCKVSMLLWGGWTSDGGRRPK